MTGCDLGFPFIQIVVSECDYLVLLVSLVLILPLSLLRNLGEQPSLKRIEMSPTN